MGVAVQRDTSSFAGAPKILVLTKNTDDFLIMWNYILIIYVLVNTTEALHI
jgi:hypothetical protein